MKFATRTLKDPYAGRGLGLLAITNEASYEVDFCAGLTENLFEAQIRLTPPFDPAKFNTKGENDYSSDLKELSATVSLFWIQVSISFYITR